MIGVFTEINLSRFTEEYQYDIQNKFLNKIKDNSKTDTQLVVNYNNSEEDANILFKRHHPMILDIAYKLANKHTKLDSDEIYSNAVVGFMHAINKFDPNNKTAKFSSYAHICIKGYAINYIKETIKERNRDEISFDDPTAFSTDEKTSTVQELVSDSSINISRERDLGIGYDIILDNQDVLTERESSIFKLFYIDDMSAVDIAERIGTHRKTVYNTIASAIKKLKVVLLKYGINTDSIEDEGITGCIRVAI